jgi:hypothetical protein
MNKLGKRTSNCKVDQYTSRSHRRQVD